VFISVWNDFLLPFIIMRDDRLLTLAAGLIKLDGEYVKQWGEMMAGIRSRPCLWSSFSCSPCACLCAVSPQER
jgi:hypothetical protein